MSIIAPNIFTLLYAGLGLLAFVGVYERWMHRESFYQANRMYVLIAPLLALLIPHLQWEVTLNKHSNPALYLLEQGQQLPAAWLNRLGAAPSEEFTLSWGKALLFLYLVGVFMTLIRSAYTYYKVWSWIWRGKKRKFGKWSLVEHPLAPDAASFFRFIFWNKPEPMPDLVLQHEQIHIEQGHSWDVLLMELWIALFWFHPLVYRLRIRLQETHEFIADAAVIAAQGSKYAYASLLVSQQKNFEQMPYRTFAAQLSTRLRRMTQAGSPQWKILQYAVCLPLVLSLLLFFSVTYLRALPNISPATGALTESIQLLAEKPVMPAIVPAKMIQPTTQKTSGLPLIEKRSFQITRDTVPIKNSIKITTGSKINVIGNGQTITVNPDGKITTGAEKPLLIIDGKNMGRIDQSDKENALAKMDPGKIAAISVLKGESATAIYGEEGKEGVLVITTKDNKGGEEPIHNISINKTSVAVDGAKVEINSNDNNVNSKVKVNTSGLNGTPLIIKDGKVLGRLNKGESGVPLKDIDPNIIKSITIHKGQSAIDKYGKDAEDGAIEITTKQ